MGASALPAPQTASILGVIAALSSEAACLGPMRRRPDGSLVLTDGTLVRVSGMGQGAAAAAAESLARLGVTAFLSWGVAGGLDPQLPCGSVLLATEVLEEDGAQAAATTRRPTLRPWREQLARRYGAAAVQGTLLSGPDVVASPRHKARLFERTGARAVDMESAAIAAVAAQQGLSFMAVRVIVDSAQDAIPQSLSKRLASGNSFGVLVAMPWLWPSLMQLAFRYRRARTALKRCAEAGVAP